MANASFTRDEVILALDVLYRSGGVRLQPNSPEIQELSSQLNLLPIHAKDKRPPNFRNCVGVSHQLDRFLRGYSDGRTSWNVGELFFRVDQEYRNNHNELYAVADAIRKNALFFSDYMFGDVMEDDGFPEGIILGHLHRVVEKRDSKKLAFSSRCDICQLEPEALYSGCGTILEHHLVVRPEKINWNKTYKSSDFITVCPNCHTALHRRRPWVEKGNYDIIFR